MTTRWAAATESSAGVPLGAFATLLGGRQPSSVMVGVDDAQ